MHAGSRLGMYVLAVALRVPVPLELGNLRPILTIKAPT